MGTFTEAQEKWLTALESGAYVQTTGTLKKRLAAAASCGYCCLGVAVEVLPDEFKAYGVVKYDMSVRSEHDQVAMSVLDQLSYKVLGIHGSEGRILAPRSFAPDIDGHVNDYNKWKLIWDVLPERLQKVATEHYLIGARFLPCLTKMNDTGMTHQEIAAAVRKYPQYFLENFKGAL